MPLAKRSILLFCPFDGGEAAMQDFGVSARFRYQPVCRSCGAKTAACKSQIIAAERWNARVERKPAKRAQSGYISDLEFFFWLLLIVVAILGGCELGKHI